MLILEIYKKNAGHYLNTCLPLIPEIRQMTVIKGLRDLTLSLFGIVRYRRETSINVLEGGPNRKANRYLRYQYKRLLSYIEAYPAARDPDRGLEII